MRPVPGAWNSRTTRATLLAAVLKDCAAPATSGIELGPIGFMPEDPAVLGEALADHGLTLIGGVVFRPFHDPAKWDEVMDAAERTCKALVAHGAEHLVLIDSISPRRAPTAGRATRPNRWTRPNGPPFATASPRWRGWAEVYGLTVGIHAHAAGFIDFEPELERLLDEVDERLLKICFDTGHHSYAGFDPVAFMKRHIGRISYMHFKDIDPAVKARAIARRTGFYEACGQGIFCNLGRGDVDFPPVRQVLLDAGFDGWCTVEQDCDPTLDVRPVDDARAQPRLPLLHRLQLISGIERTPHGKLNWGLIGGGEGSQIGPAHRLGARVDGEFEFVAGALDHRPRRGEPTGRSWAFGRPFLWRLARDAGRRKKARATASTS
jgi:inosose dehydratase